LTRMTAPSLGSPAWSPDGRWIAFDTRVGSSSDVYVVSSGGDTMRRFTPDDGVNEGAPVFSRDGKHLYFASNRSGKGNYYRQRIVDGQPVGEAVQLTTSGALDGFETPDGNWFVVGRGRANYGLLAVPVEGGPERPYHDRAGYWRSWGINSLGLYYITKENTPRQTAVLEPFGRKLSVPLFQIEREPLWYQPGLSMSEDGRLVAFAQRDHVINELLMVENFR
jgi:Tol biopolymer transport system component